MKITKIKKIGNKNYYHIYSDETWLGIFLDEIIVKYNIKTNCDIEESKFTKIKEENDMRVAFDMAASYLEKYVVSEKGIKDYLKKKGFTIQTIDKTISKLKDYTLIDDEKFARNYFETLSYSKGKRAISLKLKQKGISNEIIQNILENINDNDEFEKARYLAEKFAKNRQNDTKNKQKCLAHLIYKGYDYSIAQKATNEVFKNNGENDYDRF